MPVSKLALNPKNRNVPKNVNDPILVYLLLLLFLYKPAVLRYDLLKPD